MNYWSYKAIDATGRTYTGVISAVNEPEAILSLRQQQQLQIVELVEVELKEYLQQARIAHQITRLQRRMQRLVKPTKKDRNQPIANITPMFHFPIIRLVEFAILVVCVAMIIALLLKVL